MSLESSYQQFTIENNLNVVEGKGNLPLIEVENKYASASVSIYGAQVLSFKPKTVTGLELSTNAETEELLFISENSYFEEGKAIKGGIPICWPWFGRDPENNDRQMHGFARNMLWNLEKTQLTTDDETKITLSLCESDESYKLWPHDFKITLTIIIGKTLRLSLQTTNTGNETLTITQALHAYFSIADINETHVSGLDKVKYLDKVLGAEEDVLQIGNISVDKEVDRIYINAPSKTLLVDEKLHRLVSIDSNGSKTTIVWNPWVDISKNSEDLSDDAYQKFICVETANAANDLIVLAPNESAKIEAEYSISAIN